MGMGTGVATSQALTDATAIMYVSNNTQHAGSTGCTQQSEQRTPRSGVANELCCGCLFSRRPTLNGCLNATEDFSGLQRTTSHIR